MPWNPESAKIFVEETKSQIFINSQLEIAIQLERAKKFPVEDRPIIAFGATFEALAVNENLSNHPETPKQKEIRELIQKLYEKAEITLGKQWPSKPDFVSVRFEDKVVINEIIEMKTSEKALDHGLSKGQPQNAVLTIESIVDLLNQMVEAEKVTQVEVINKLTGKYDSYRRKFLTETFNQIKKLGLTEKVSFSDDLQYHVILAADSPNINRDILINHGGKPIKVLITKSQYSKRDVHNVIDHWVENNVE